MSEYFGWIKEKTGSVASLLWEHKKKTALAAVVAGGAYAYYKIKPIWDDIQNSLKMMESLDKRVHNGEQARRAVLEQQFQKSLLAANSTLRDLLENVRVDLQNTLFDIDALQTKLKTRAKGQQHDIATWNQLKIQGFARAFSTMYAICFLHALVKVQLCIISRYMFNDGGQPNSEANTTFMNICKFAQTDGVRELAHGVTAAVSKVLSSDKWNLDSPCTFEDVMQMLSEFRRAFEHDLHQIESSAVSLSAARGGQQPTAPFFSYLFPPADKFSYPPPSAMPILNNPAAIESLAVPNAAGQFPPGSRQAALQEAMRLNTTVRLAEMVEETRAVLQTPSFQRILLHSFDTAFEEFARQLKVVFDPPAGAPSSDAPARVPFAKVITRATKLFEILLPAQVATPCPILDALAARQDVQQFCSIIYFPLTEQKAVLEFRAQTQMNTVTHPVTGLTQFQSPQNINFNVAAEVKESPANPFLQLQSEMDRLGGDPNGVNSEIMRQLEALTRPAPAAFQQLLAPSAAVPQLTAPPTIAPSVPAPSLPAADPAAASPAAVPANLAEQIKGVPSFNAL